MAIAINKICIICGTNFLGHYNTKYCENCRPYNYARPTTPTRDGYHFKRKKKKKIKIKSIQEVLLEMKNYNKLHNTNYTYGQYLSAVQTGRIQEEVKPKND